MLRKFVYLDTASLAEYTATLEGGLIAETKMRSSKKGSKGGKLAAKVLEGSLSSDNETEHTWDMSDTAEAQFERLLDAANADADAIGWIDVMEPDGAFASANIGEFISWECDAYIPEIFNIIAATGSGVRNLNLAESILDTMKKGVDEAAAAHTEIPPETTNKLITMGIQLDAVKGILNHLQSPRKVVGEDSEVTSWKVFGELTDEHMRETEIDDRLVIVGKIKRRLNDGKWRPLVDIRGLDYPNRAERRKRLHEIVPNPGQEEHFVQGPALELDVLAIYR
ncbi:hypothetical protein [Mycobacterium sp. E2238]|uniref:DUF6414 family protein n=1 Tax=Mycobacterium sp. E2238 TaxID=1834131 RepID=UPI0007FDF979|nr:hypothetical protein [Mycobacterium sp. E2238]OBI23832.1 hypothetical protein A5711_10040 [Mycobacterium sp. E2238]